MKNLLRVISLFLTITLIMGLCACSKPTGDMSSAEVEIQHTTEYIGDASSVESAVSDTQSVQSSTESVVSNNESQNIVSSNVSSTSSENTSSKVDTTQTEDSSFKVTICAAVSPNTYVIGGVCPVDTEYVRVGGTNTTETKIIPAKGKTNSYFIGQIKISDNASLEIQYKQSGKDLSKKLFLFAFYNSVKQNMQTGSDYKPFFGSDSRMHFYSALLSYSLSNVVNGGVKDAAQNNIGEIVNAANKVGAEVIYLVVPSSAAVYPETVPSEYKAASGESIYEAFSSIATKCGAKVIYPLDTMKVHKNDGDGYKIYSHTDSHWTTYGAYWGVYELMNHIGSKYPSAKPRTVSDMGFYTTELYGGDALFSFDDNRGFENYSAASKNSGKTVLTGINEYTTLYSRKMPTDTLSKITRNKTSIYLTKDNEAAHDFTNQNGAGLPSAVIVRDSFGRTAFDMVNDRFGEIAWLAEGDYTSVSQKIAERSPNYVVYIVSERNLIKVMLANKDIALKNFA
ncbi:MAG: hypothetical protein IJZ21_02425 [Clostridia bacterium]|nr:hypothetical protein [Clostridia bacterium]